MEENTTPRMEVASKDKFAFMRLARLRLRERGWETGARLLYLVAAEMSWHHPQFGWLLPMNKPGLSQRALSEEAGLNKGCGCRHWRKLAQAGWFSWCDDGVVLTPERGLECALRAQRMRAQGAAQARSGRSAMRAQGAAHARSGRSAMQLRLYTKQTQTDTQTAEAVDGKAAVAAGIPNEGEGGRGVSEPSSSPLSSGSPIQEAMAAIHKHVPRADTTQLARMAEEVVKAVNEFNATANAKTNTLQSKPLMCEEFVRYSWECSRHLTKNPVGRWRNIIRTTPMVADIERWRGRSQNISGPARAAVQVEAKPKPELTAAEMRAEAEKYPERSLIHAMLMRRASEGGVA